ncbi:methyl-accepting chemotaxis protein [Peribacillus glennii]|uniref:HAMP domain-containing protein n=1 Tax=Peribacillus glennii TaxID=2303991 RepID=A0A372LGY1_9BACI|nr:methyl-accepting chemotaxis protein [Peribacillus glennii]RFU65202.1 HAMP domain-containing protein [Peribacillus glennii]
MRRSKQNFFGLTIKTKLFISFLIMLLIPCLTIGWISFKTAKEKVQEQITMSAAETTKLLNSNLDRFIEPEIKSIDFLSETIHSDDYKGANSKAQLHTMIPFVSTHQEISTMFVGGKDGRFINAPAKKMPEGYDARQRPWYQEAMKQQGEVIVSTPYVSKTTGDFVVSVSKALKDGSGVIGAEIKLKTVEAFTNQVKVGKEGYAFILDKDRKVVVHPTTKPTEELPGGSIDPIFKSQNGDFAYPLDGVLKHMFFVTNERTGWKVAGTLFYDEVDKEAQPIFNKTILVLAISLIIGLGIIYIIVSSITRPLQTLVAASGKISDGDLTEEIELKSGDELGQLGDSFNDMTKNLRALVKQIGLNTDQVAASAEELTANAEETSRATEQIAHTIQEVASGSEKQLGSVEDSAVKMEELTSEVQRIAHNAQSASKSSVHTSEQAIEGEKSIQLAMEQMNTIKKTFGNLSLSIESLGSRSNEINKIIDVITDISSQTNLLALNAAIEAARAGEYGRGFAVVADEVRKLAEQSSNSAQQISNLIAAIQDETNKTVVSMNQASNEVMQGIGVVNTAGETFGQIKSAINEVVAEISDISSSVDKISFSTGQVVESAVIISKIAEEAAAGTQNVAAATEEQLASMEEISASANALTNMADELQHTIGKFKIS